MAALISTALLRSQTDRRLTELAADGSERAFEVLVERYRRPLQAYCRRMLLPQETAEDVVQQAFLSTWQALGRGTEIADVRPWLYRVAHNGAVNALRRSGYDHEELDEALSGTDAPEEDLERRTYVRRTLAGLAGLPELQREALLRTAVEGRSHEEVARDLGLTDGAVRGLVYRARTTLRAAVTALTPASVVGWAAAAAARPVDAPLAERVGELVAGGGTAGGAALLLKGGATVLSAGALAGGAVVVERKVADRPDGREHRAAQRAPAVAAESLERPGVEAAAEVAKDGRPSAPGQLRKTQRVDDRAQRASGRGRGGRGRGHDRDDGVSLSRRGSDFGPIARPQAVAPTGDDSGRHRRRGSRDEDDDGFRTDNSGPGSLDEDGDSSGSGSGGDDRLDSSGPGSGDDDDALPTPTAPTPSDPDDNSGPGGGSDDDSSGYGSSGSSGSG